MKKTFKMYEVSIRVGAYGEKDIEVRNINNMVEVSYHEIDELAETDEEAIDLHIEWMEEEEETRQQNNEFWEKYINK